jgi:hypothetical protein
LLAVRSATGKEYDVTQDLKAAPKHEKGEQAMIARLDHHPRLTALLVLTTAALVVVVITLATLLITAQPPTATSSSQSGGANPGAAAAVLGNGADSAIDRHAEVVAAYK